MMEKLTEKQSGLKKIYDSENYPAFCLDQNLTVLWVNAAGVRAFPELTPGERPESFRLNSALKAVLELTGEDESAVFPWEGNEKLLCASQFREDGSWFWVVTERSRGKKSLYTVAPVGEGIQLLTHHIRQRLFGVFNLLDSLAETLEDGESQSQEELAGVRLNCMAILKYAVNLNEYYNRSSDEGEPVDLCLAHYLTDLFEELDFKLIPTKLRVDYQFTTGDAFCRVWFNKLTAALLNVVCISARYAPPPGGILKVRAFLSEGEAVLVMEDTFSDYAEIISQKMERGMIRLDSTGETIPVKRMSLDILTQAIADMGGVCLHGSGNPGLRVVIRLPVDHFGRPTLRDNPCYTSNRNRDELSIFNIMTADLE